MTWEPRTKWTRHALLAVWACMTAMVCLNACIAGEGVATAPARATGQAGATHADGADAAVIGRVQFGATETRLRLVFWLDRPVGYRIFHLEHPSRLVVEIRHALLRANARESWIRNAMVSDIDTRTSAAGVVSFSMKLSTKVNSHAFLVNRVPGRCYLVVDLFRVPERQVSPTIAAGRVHIRQSPVRRVTAAPEKHASKRLKRDRERVPFAKVAGSPRDGATERALFWAVVQRLERALRDIHRPRRASRSDIDRLFSLDCADIGLLTDTGRALREEARASANDPGLDLEGGIRKGMSQTNSGLAANTRQSAFIGLKWDLLNGGWRDHQGRARWYALRAEQADVLARMEYEDRLNQCRADRIPDAFLPWEYRLLSLKADLLRRVLPALRRAYLRGQLFLEDVLEAEQELQVTGNDLAVLRPRLAALSRRSVLFPTMFPLLDVDMDAVLRAMDEDGLLRRRMDLDAEIKAQQRENERTARFYAFARYEADGAGFRRRGPAAGLRFDIPLFERTTAGVREWREASKARFRQTMRARKRDARHAWRKFAEERERVIRQWYRYRRAMERLRRSRLAARLDNDMADARAAAERALTAVNAAIELARADALLYRRASEIFSYAHVMYRPEFIRIDALTDGDWRARPGDRAVYLWSKTFNATPNDIILAFLRAKQARRVLLSAGGATDWNKARDFIRRARRDGIIVTPMFANNRWLEKGEAARASRAILDRLRSNAMLMVRIPDHVDALPSGPALQTLGGDPVAFESLAGHARTGRAHLGMAFVHLDIEPQMLKRHKGDKRAQARALLALLRELRARLPGQARISASVPVSWPSSAYEQLSRLVDRLYLMDYGSRKPDTLVRRLRTAIGAVAADRLVVALRAADFTSEADMEHAMEVIRARTGLEQFAIHAFRDYLRLAGATGTGVTGSRR